MLGVEHCYAWDVPSLVAISIVSNRETILVPLQRTRDFHFPAKTALATFGAHVLIAYNVRRHIPSKLRRKYAREASWRHQSGIAPE